MLTNAKIYANVPAVDLERAKKFYGDTLGLKEVAVPMPGIAMFEAGEGTGISIYEREATKADHTVAGFHVDDLEETVKELRGRGVTFEEYDYPDFKTVDGIATMGPTKAAWFKDTEGNILCVDQATE